MGSFGNQGIRNLQIQDYDVWIQDLKRTATRNNISLDQAIRVAELAERHRATSAAVLDGDYRDEQAAGFGEMLNHLNDLLEMLVSELSESK